MLKQAMQGAVLQPSEPGYDDARALWNAMIDKQHSNDMGLPLHIGDLRNVQIGKSRSQERRANEYIHQPTV